MDGCPACASARDFAGWRQNCTTAKTPGGLEMVWKWSGFPGARAPERGSMTAAGTAILQAENQNRCGWGRARRFRAANCREFMERPEKVITKPSAVRPELGRRDTESPDMFLSAPLRLCGQLLSLFFAEIVV